MRNPLAVVILFLAFAFMQAHAATVIFLGVQPSQCAAFAPLAADLNTVKFPADWKIYVACSDVTWKQVASRSDVTGTDAAYTSRRNKFTVLNGMVYSPAFSLEGYTQKTPHGILKHELGHITCDTSDERTADRYADKGVCR